MSALTKSWLQKQITDLEATRDEIPFGLDEDSNNTLAALKMALAGMEAEPVGEVSEQSDGLVMDGTVDLGGKSTHRIINGASKMKRLPLGTKFYTAPQPLTTSERAELENYRNAQQVVPDVEPYMHGLWPNAVDALMRYANACRAAMLQGKAEPVTTAYKLPANTPCKEAPDGCCIMPMKLTADNGAKGALSGEFHVTHRIICQSCGGEGCEDCTIPQLNKLLTFMFGESGRCYVRNDGEMVMSYVFEFQLSTVELAIVQSSGALPAPIGVTVNIVQQV